MASSQEPNRTYHFEIITRTGGHVNTSAMGHGLDNAKYHLMQQYEGCTSEHTRAPARGLGFPHRKAYYSA